MACNRVKLQACNGSRNHAGIMGEGVEEGDRGRGGELVGK